MVAVFVLDRTKHCRFINAVAEHLTGVQLPQAVGRPLADLIWHGDPQAFEHTHLGRALAASHAEEGEETLLDGDGVKRAMAFRVVPVELGSSGATVVELYGLEGETGAARALRESERRLRLATEATGIGIWDVNVVTGQRRWSSEVLAILGLPPETRPSTDLFLSLVHPDDRNWLDELYRDAYRSPTAEPYDAEFRITRASDGAERWLHTNGRVSFDNEGRPIRGVGTLHDITERKNAEAALLISEERHRLAIEANELGTWDVDIATGQHQWSAQFRRLCGLPADAPADPDRMRALMDPEDWQAVQKELDKAYAPGSDGRFAVERKIRRADTGELRWISLFGRVFFDETGSEPLRAVGIVMDTTARKVAEEHQRHLLRELHHRINNNLAVVQAILWQTIRTTRKPGDAFPRIQTRLAALARVHELLARSEFGEATLREMLSTELSQLGGFSQRVTLEGGPVLLDSTSAVILALVFHELTTNAARHGGLSVPDGNVNVSWTVSGGDDLRIDLAWSEQGARKNSRRRPEGFGMRIIRDSITGTLAGKAEVDFQPKGVNWRLSVPLGSAGASRQPALAGP